MVSLPRWPLLWLSLLLLAGAVPPPNPGTAAGVYVLDSRSGKSLVMVLPSLELAVLSKTGETRLGVEALSARFLPDGQIAFIDPTLALRRFGPRGAANWLPPGSANAPLFVSPDGQTLAYLKPLGLQPGDNEPSANGVAVLDLATNAERLLFQVPDVTVRLYGWVGQQLLVEVPSWSPATNAPVAKMALGLLNIDGPQAAPRALADLPPLLPGAHYPQTSLDQSYLAYQSAVGLVVASLSSGNYGLLGAASDPLWSDAGLSAVVNGHRAGLAVSPADLTQSSPATGDVALPVAPGLALPVPTRPAQPGAILFYRPVKASTPISAYMDLDYNLGTIADWTGWTGTNWVYGHAYDNHKGTDYDGVTGDAVYAAAPGTVDVVVIDCVNTYPGGPGSFGSYVRIDHGQLSDGFSYKTIYGHLKCDAVFAHQGDVIATLPTQLGQMGNTGYSSGDHTHLQVYRNNITIDPYSANIISDNPPLSTVGDLDGIVRDVNGQLASGVTVKIASGGLYQTAITGADGAYHFSAVRAGATSPTAVRDVRWGTTGANIVAAQAVSAPDIILDQCGGTTTGADGCPAVNFDAAAFLADVTVPDTGVVLPGQSLTKTWRLGNTGSSAWGAGYQAAFIGGVTLSGAPAAVNVPATQPNDTVTVTVTFSAPSDAGVHRAYWRLRSPNGAFFGPWLWAELNVQPAGAGITSFTASPASPSAASLVHITAQSEAVANFRAQRLLIDGSVVTETTAVTLNYDWPTAGLDTVEHSLVVQAADQSDLNYAHPQWRGLNYALQGPPALEVPIDHDAPDPVASSPSAPGTVLTCAVQVLPASSSSNPFTVNWTGSGVQYNVQFLDSGRGNWRDWLRGVATTSAAFSGQSGHAYGFRCLAIDSSGNQGSYPGSADTSTLLGAQSGLADLTVTNLTAVPNTGGGALGLVTIQNLGASATQRGFFVDLYEDHSPSGVGDFTGSVQNWAVAPLAAGATITLTGVVPQASGQHTAALFAQVDSTGVVSETDEGNNIWITGTGACLVAADGFENDNTPSTAKLLASGTSQGHSFGGPGDRDWMLLDAQPGHMYQFTTSNLAFGVDTRLMIYGAGGAGPLAFNDDADATTLASQLFWSPPAAGTYYLVADNWNPGFGGCGSYYTVSAQDLGPGYVLFLPLSRR